MSYSYVKTVADLKNELEDNDHHANTRAEEQEFEILEGLEIFIATKTDNENQDFKAWPIQFSTYHHKKSDGKPVVILWPIQDKEIEISVD